jgi:hypothetical protein
MTTTGTTLINVVLSMFPDECESESICLLLEKSRSTEMLTPEMVRMSRPVMCMAQLQAVGQAKPGPIRPSQARPKSRLDHGFGLA